MEAGLSNAQAAEYLDVSTRTIRRYKSGKSKASKATIIALEQLNKGETK